jgi:hypothetical protein
MKNVAKRQCVVCGREKPATVDHFADVGRGKRKLSKTCLICEMTDNRRRKPQQKVFKSPTRRLNPAERRRLKQAYNASWDAFQRYMNSYRAYKAGVINKAEADIRRAQWIESAQQYLDMEENV